MKENLVSKRNL